MIWADTLADSPPALQDFLEYVDREIGLATQDIETAIGADDVNTARIALGRKEALVSLRNSFGADERERAAHAEYRREAGIRRTRAA